MSYGTPNMSILNHQEEIITNSGQFYCRWRRLPSQILGCSLACGILIPAQVAEVLKPLAVIVWSHLRRVGLRMLSVGLHLALLGSNISIIKIQMGIFIFRGPPNMSHLLALGCVLQHPRMCAYS